MCPGLAGPVNAIEADSSCNVIKAANLVPLGFKGNRSYLSTSPKAEEDSNDRKKRMQQ